MTNITHDLLFQQWKASLPNRDRSKDAVSINFTELFESLLAEGMTFEEAHELLPKAIKAHYPTSSHVKNAWKKWKHLQKWDNEKAFEEEWQQDISNRASAAFFEVYPIKTKALPKVAKVEEPKPIGKLTTQEYKLMREYADSIPSFDFDALEREQVKDSDVDLDDLLRKVDSESK